MAQQLSFGQALNEAKQIILEQSNRIRTDAEKIRIQEQAIVDQCATIAELERKLREQGQAAGTSGQGTLTPERRRSEESTAQSQGDKAADQQAQRITSLQTSATDLEAQLAQAAEQLAQVTRQRDEQFAQAIRERDALRQQIPSPEDEQALAAMTLLLSNHGSSQRHSRDSLRISGSPKQAQAA